MSAQSEYVGTKCEIADYCHIFAPLLYCSHVPYVLGQILLGPQLIMPKTFPLLGSSYCAVSTQSASLALL